MPLETAIYIDTLQPDWPLGIDPESQGDDHLRMIKQVLQSTFPAFNSAVEGASSDLNSVSLGLLYRDADPADGYDSQRFDALGKAEDGTWSIDAALHAGTPTISELNVHTGLVPNWSVIQNMLYPVGTIHISSNAANPATYMGFGTWTARTGYIYGAGSATDSQSHAYTIAAGQQSAFWYVQASNIANYKITIDSAGAHVHNNPNASKITAGNGGSGSSGNTYQVVTYQAAGQTDSQGNHSHTATIGLQTQPSIRPGWAFYVWERTA